MSDIQRWTTLPIDGYAFPSDDGPWVTYADHVAAVAAALGEAVQRYREAVKGGDDCGCESCLAYTEKVAAAIKGDSDE